MALTVLADVVLPESFVEGNIRGKQQRKNLRASNQAGFAKANIVWETTLRRYELGFVPMPVADWQTIEGLFEVTEGGAYGFLMRDPKDSNAAAGEGFLQPYLSANVGTVGYGYGIPTYRLSKLYSVAGSTRTRLRRITRPTGAVVKRAGSAVVEGAAAGQIDLDTDTGLITFVADTSEGPTSISVGATTVVHFASGAGVVAAMSVGDRLYLSGVLGTAADTLNGKSHAITAKGASTLTLNVNTATLTATNGTAWKYPQPSETLTWTGGFHVPVQFETDEIDWEALASGDEDERVIAGRSIVLVEVRE